MLDWFASAWLLWKDPRRSLAPVFPHPAEFWRSVVTLLRGLPLRGVAIFVPAFRVLDDSTRVTHEREKSFPCLHLTQPWLLHSSSRTR